MPAVAAAAPLPPCFPTTSPVPDVQAVVPDPAGTGTWVPAVPLLVHLLRLPGVVYCDPSLPLPDLSSLGTILPGGLIASGTQVIRQLVPELPHLPVVPAIPGAPAAPAETPIVLDESAPLFTQPAAQAGAERLSIEGLRSVDIVEVRVTGGDTIPAIRIIADAVTIDGFMLDVKPEAGGPAAVNTSDRMVLRGNAKVYLQSLTATGPGGLGISLLAPTPVPGGELPPTLVRATFGLVGSTADSSDWIHTDLRMHADS